MVITTRDDLADRVAQAARVRHRQERPRRPPPHRRVRHRARRPELPARRDRRGDGRRADRAAARASSSTASASTALLARRPRRRSRTLRAARLRRTTARCRRATTASSAVLRRRARRPARGDHRARSRPRASGRASTIRKALPDTAYYRDRYGYRARVLPERDADQRRARSRSRSAPHVSEADVERIVDDRQGDLIQRCAEPRGPPHRPDRRGRLHRPQPRARAEGARRRRRGHRRAGGQPPRPLRGAAARTSPNRDLYLKHPARAPRPALHDAGIPLHRQDARDYHGLSQHAHARSRPTRSSTWPPSRTRTAPTRTRSRRSTTRCARSRTRSTGRAAATCERFVFFSSCDGLRQLPHAGGRPRTTRSSRSASTARSSSRGEKLVIAYNQVFGLPYTILRPSALYGPRCVSRRVGQAFIESALVGDRLRVDGDGRREARLHLRRRRRRRRDRRDHATRARATRSST